MDQALYYTFSTIAQTLGAAIALLGAFVFYRLQFLNAAIAHVVTQQVLQHFGGKMHLTLQEFHAKGKHADLLRCARSPSASGATEHLHTPLARLEELVTEKSLLLVRFRYSLISTVVVTGFAVAALALVPTIIRCWRAEWFLAVGVLAFVACLGTFARLLLGDLK